MIRRGMVGRRNKGVGGGESFKPRKRTKEERRGSMGREGVQAGGGGGGVRAGTVQTETGR